MSLTGSEPPKMDKREPDKTAERYNSPSESVQVCSDPPSANLRSQLLHEIPAEVFAQRELRCLYLDSNNLTHLPKHITLLSCLQLLSITHNQLSQLPLHLCELETLTSLSAYGNPITSLPSALSCLSNLRKLELEHDGVMSIRKAHPTITSLPCWNTFQVCFVKMSAANNWVQMKKVDLSMNNLSVLPSCFATLTSLRTLNISRNKFEDIPSCLYGMTWLESLDISGNRIREIKDDVPHDPDIMSAYARKKDTWLHVLSRPNPLYLAASFPFFLVIAKLLTPDTPNEIYVSMTVCFCFICYVVNRMLQQTS